jgi:His-Xaa-Ser system protein HxsD
MLSIEHKGLNIHRISIQRGIRTMGRGNVVSKDVSNLRVHEGCCMVHVNARIFPKEVVYCAAYAFLDRAYVVLDGDPSIQIIVELHPKVEGKDVTALGLEFNNELLNFAVYKVQSGRNSRIKEPILKQAFDSTIPEDSCVAVEPKKGLQEPSFVNDPLGIARPWEEVFGKDSR